MIDEILRSSAPLNNIAIILNEVKSFLSSTKRYDMLSGVSYYNGEHDILNKNRTAIGVDGTEEIIDNLPNNKIVDNQYKKMVNQKKNYIVGQPITFQCENEKYLDVIKAAFNKKFDRTLKNVIQDSLNCGIGWIYVFYNSCGEIDFKRIRPYEVIPLWDDADHTSLDSLIRMYSRTEYLAAKETVVTIVEYYTKNGVDYFELTDALTPIEPFHQDYFTINGNGYNWDRIPMIPFKYNSDEIPLINMVKSLQDGLNTIESNFQNNMEEDIRNTILVLVNYDGQNLGEFRKNLATYGAVKVRTLDGAAGDVKTLQIEVNADNYKSIIQLFKKAIIENAMGYDAKDDRLGGQANQMNIRSMYSDIDLDANEMETEYQASMEQLLWFIANTQSKNITEIVEVIFNRDMLMNEGEIIENLIKSKGILSDETILAQHPWVDDIQKELERVNNEHEEKMKEYGFPLNNKSDEGAKE